MDEFDRTRNEYIAALQREISMLRHDREALLTALVLERRGESRQAICQGVLGRVVD